MTVSASVWVRTFSSSPGKTQKVGSSPGFSVVSEYGRKLCMTLDNFGMFTRRKAWIMFEKQDVVALAHSALKNGIIKAQDILSEREMLAALDQLAAERQSAVAGVPAKPTIAELFTRSQAS
jgi:hypothetical protein